MFVLLSEKTAGPTPGKTMEGEGVGSLVLTGAGWEGAVDLLHHLCEVGAGVMRGGQQVLRCWDSP